MYNCPVILRLPRLIVCAVLGFGSSAFAGDDPGLWTAVLAMGDSPVAAVGRADAIRDVLHAIGGEIVVDAASVALMRDVRSATLQLNLRKLYGMLPEEHGESRRVRAVGGPIQGRYALTYFPVQTGPQPPADTGIGAFNAQMTMVRTGHKHGRGQSYGFDGIGALETGSVTHQDITHGLEALLVWMDEVARAGDPEQVSESLWVAFETSMPHVSAMMDGVVVVDRLATFTDDRLRVDLAARTDVDQLVNYPALGRYLGHMGDLLDLQLRLLDDQGRSLGQLGLSSKNAEMTLRFDTRDGALLPLQATTGSLVPTTPSADLILDVRLAAKMDGITLLVDDYRMPLTYRSGDDVGRLTLDIASEPKLELGGTSAFTGWLVSWADDLFDFGSQANRVFEAVAHGPEGDGTQVQLIWLDGDGRIEGTGKMELVDNSLIRFAMRMTGRHLVPNDEVMGEILGLVSNTLSALDQDYQRIRPVLTNSGGGPGGGPP